jgi:hypothetical protein
LKLAFIFALQSNESQREYINPSLVLEKRFKGKKEGLLGIGQSKLLTDLLEKNNKYVIIVNKKI